MAGDEAAASGSCPHGAAPAGTTLSFPARRCRVPHRGRTCFPPNACTGSRGGFPQTRQGVGVAVPLCQDPRGLLCPRELPRASPTPGTCPSAAARPSSHRRQPSDAEVVQEHEPSGHIRARGEAELLTDEPVGFFFFFFFFLNILCLWALLEGSSVAAAWVSVSRSKSPLRKGAPRAALPTAIPLLVVSSVTVDDF